MATGTERTNLRRPASGSGRVARGAPIPTRPRALLSAALLATMLVATASITLAPPAGAAGVIAQYEGNETADTVRVVVGSLIGIGVVTAILLAAYVWHTSPRRRQRLAAERSGSAAAAEIDAGEDRAADGGTGWPSARADTPEAAGAVLGPDEPRTVDGEIRADPQSEARDGDGPDGGATGPLR